MSRIIIYYRTARRWSDSGIWIKRGILRFNGTDLFIIFPGARYVLHKYWKLVTIMLIFAYKMHFIILRVRFNPDPMICPVIVIIGSLILIYPNKVITDIYIS